MPASSTAPAISPHGVSAGAPAAALAHVPVCPGRLQSIRGPVQALSQQTLSTQKPVEHSEGVEHAPPWGMRVLVGVAVAVAVAVTVAVGVAVAVTVGVAVGVSAAAQTG